MLKKDMFNRNTNLFQQYLHFQTCCMRNSKQEKFFLNIIFRLETSHKYHLT